MIEAQSIDKTCTIVGHILGVTSTSCIHEQTLTEEIPSFS